MIHANLICLENFISMQELEINTKVKNLFSLLQEGTLEEGELFFLAALRKIRKIPNLDDVTDEIEQEIFINSFHSDDYINNENIKFHWIYMLFFCKKLKDILLESVEFFLDIANLKYIKINYEFDSCFVKMDKTKAQRVFNNLISNAIKYSKKDSQINLKLSMV